MLVTLFGNDGKLGAGTLMIPAFAKEEGRIYSLKIPDADAEDGPQKNANLVLAHYRHTSHENGQLVIVHLLPVTV